MTNIFQPDVFSNSMPAWTEGESLLSNTISDILACLPGRYHLMETSIKSSASLEVNSTNIQFISNDQKYLLKKWNCYADCQHAEGILKIMESLKGTNIPISAPLKFSNGKYIHYQSQSAWSIFPFVEGNYFSGKGNELNLASEYTTRLMVELGKLDMKQYPIKHGRKYLTYKDLVILNNMENIRYDWHNIFGDNIAAILEDEWSNIIEEWDRLYGYELYAGEQQISHTDLHPYNILTMNRKIVALLDFDSCKITPVGYSLAYAAFKQCRQTMVVLGCSANAAEVGGMYIEKINQTIPYAKNWTDNFNDLVMSEIIMRLFAVFQQNVDDNCSKWNNVIPSLLLHLRESRLLFV